MKRSGKRFSVIMALVIACLFTIPTIRGATATGPAEIIRVFAPSAYFTWSGGVSYGDTNQRKLDMNPIALLPDGGFTQSSAFTDPSYVNYWAPYDNRSNFPPNSATFLSVKMIAIVWCQIPRPFQLAINFYNGVNWTYFSTGYYNAGMLPQLYSYNVTGLTSNWTQAQIHETTTGFSVSVLAWTPSSRALYVDYVGLDYTWTNGTTSGDTGSESVFTMPDAVGLMGLVGFGGMVVIPASTIWFMRRDGDTKIHAGLVAALAFLFSFVLFISSLGL